jgi:hypothetical protein
MENRNGLPVDFTIAAPTGTSEREQAKLLIAGLVAKGFCVHRPIVNTDSRAS